MRKISHFSSYFENNDINGLITPTINPYNPSNIELFELENKEKNNTVEEFFIDNYNASTLDVINDGRAS
jgi:hypothetical protein